MDGIGIFPPQYFDQIVRTANDGHQLMAVVLEDAVRVYAEHANARDRLNRGLFRAVERWLRDDAITHPLAFLNIADELRIDPVWFRNVMSRWRAYQRALRDTTPSVRVERLAS